MAGLWLHFTHPIASALMLPKT